MSVNPAVVLSVKMRVPTKRFHPDNLSDIMSGIMILTDSTHKNWSNNKLVEHDGEYNEHMSHPIDKGVMS